MPLYTQTLHTQLLDKFRTMNYHSLLQTVALLLTRMGYQDVQFTSRTRFVGRTHDTGVDLRAFWPVPGGRRKVVIQVKQYPADRLIYQRTLNELRGVVLAEGATEGLLITTSGYAQTVSFAKTTSYPVAPLRLIDAAELALLCTFERVGVKVRASAKPRALSRYKLDRPFFRMMAQPGCATALLIAATKQRHAAVVNA